ncbi:MAG: hypothetical protein JO110_05580 [Acetobacteraceae bacterium]|nr:hypothetical protein [Acetobacteraceae bacterium]
MADFLRLSERLSYWVRRGEETYLLPRRGLKGTFWELLGIIAGSAWLAAMGYAGILICIDALLLGIDDDEPLWSVLLKGALGVCCLPFSLVVLVLGARIWRRAAGWRWWLGVLNADDKEFEREVRICARFRLKGFDPALLEAARAAYQLAKER